MENYFDESNENVLSYILEKLMGGKPNVITSVILLSEKAKNIMNNDNIYIQSLKFYPEMVYSYNRFNREKNSKDNWINKLLLFKIANI